MVTPDRYPTLVHLVDARARAHPERLAYRYLLDGEVDGATLEMSYADLWRQSTAIAARLSQIGQRGQRVLLVYPPCLDFVPAFLGCLLAGAVAVPLYPPDPARLQRTLERLRAVARDARPSAVLTQGALAKMVPMLADHAPELAALTWIGTDTLDHAMGAGFRTPEVAASDLAFLQYTSGSTGSPKGVMVSHGNLVHNQQQLQAAVRHDSAAIVCGWLPLIHDMGLIGNVLHPMWMGLACILMSPLDFVARPIRWLRAISHYRATTGGGPNFGYALCTQKITGDEVATLDLSCWRLAYCGAEPIRKADIDAFVERFRPAGFNPSALFPCYGLAEGTLFTTANPHGTGVLAEHLDRAALEQGRAVTGDADQAQVLVSCGHTWGGQIALVVDPETRRALPDGHVGEVWIHGRSVAQGYWGNPEASAETFRAALEPSDGCTYLRTGDLGFLRDGQVYICGRLKDSIIIRGRNHHPHDLESTTERAHAAVRPGCTASFAVETEDGEGVVVVAEVGRRGQAFAPDEVGAAIAREIRREHGLSPHEVVLIAPGTIPKTTSGKIQRLACKRAWREGGLEIRERYRAAVDGPPVASREAGDQPRLRERLAALSEPEHRHRQLAGWLIDLLHGITGIERGHVRSASSTEELGLDSLMLVHAQSAIALELGIAPTLMQLRGSGAHGLATELLARMDAAGHAVENLPAVRAPVVPAPEDRHQPFPLTDLQQAYWLGERGFFDLGGLCPHVYLEIDVSGLDPARLEAAIRALIARHDMLRATVNGDGDANGDSAGQWRVVAEAPQWSLPREDLSHLSPDAQERLLAEVRRAMTDHGPTADEWPLFEVRAHRLATGLEIDRWRVHASIHLLIFDQGTGMVIARDLARFLAEPDVQLEPLHLNFRDTVMAAKAWEGSAQHAQAAAWWRERLPDLPDAPRLPMALRADVLDLPRFRHRVVHIDANGWARLRARAQAHGLTPAASLCAAFCEVLATWAEEPRFLLNVLVADRQPIHHQIGELIGNFNTTVLLDVALPSGSFADRARALQVRLHEAIEHAAFSGVRVLRERNRMRGGGTEAGAPIVFVYNVPSAPADAHVWMSRLDRLYTTVQTAQVSLESQIQPHLDGGISLIVDAVDELFPDGMVDAMFEAYAKLVRDLSADDGDRVWQRPVATLAPSGHLALIDEAHAISAPLPSGLLHEGFEAMARRHPERIAVVSGEVRLSYADLDRMSARLAGWLQARGARPDQLVAVDMDRGWQQVVAVLGVLRSGAAYLPVDPALPEMRRSWLLDQCEARLCVTRVVDLDGGFDGHPCALRPAPSSSPENLAYVIFTSGSTGKPKGVAIEHQSALNTVVDINERWQVGPDDRVLALSSLSFDLSVYDLFGPLSVGGAVIIPLPDQARDPAAWMRLCEDEGVTVWNSVPALMSMALQWIKDRHLRLSPSLRLVLLSGDWIPTSLPGELGALGGEMAVVSLGGATEGSIWSIAYPIDEVAPAWTSIPYGKALANQTVRVLDAELRPRPIGVVGEIYIGGAGVARGYWRDPERTTERFVTDLRTGERLYRTGDLGRLMPSGDIEFLGRRDFQVKIQGYRVELGEIEVALAAHPRVRACVVGTAGARFDYKRLVAWVSSTSATSRPDEALHGELAAWLAERLPIYMVPSAFVHIDEIPLTSSGKVDRRALPDPEHAQTSSRGHVPARTATEMALVALWEALLEVEGIGITDRFADLGGHSLLAVHLVARARQRWDVELPLAAVFQHPTIEELAALIDAGGPQSSDLLVPLSPRVEGEPLFLIHPIGGSPMCYAALAREMRAARPVMGVQALGLIQPGHDCERLEELAAHYAGVILERQPEGPLHLAGWSMGGCLAFEIARHVRARGRSVALLALIDSDVPSATTEIDEVSLLAGFVRDLGGLAEHALSLDVATLATLDRDARVDQVLRVARAAGVVPVEIEREQFVRLVDLFVAHTRALTSWRPRPLDLPLDLLLPQSRRASSSASPQRGWEPYARSVRVHRIPGDHYSIVGTAGAKAVAEVLRALERSRDPGA
jgi:amino acid adenylation domain-containing protein